MRYFTDSILLLLYSTLTFFYVPADQALVFALLFAVILCCITYLCRVCKTESCSHNSLPVLKPAGNIIPVLAGSYVIFGLCSLWFSDLLLFFPLLLYQTLSAGLFPLAVAELPLWGFLVFQINRFPAVLCLLGFLVSFSHFFSGSMPENIRLFTRIFIRSEMTVRNIRFFFLKKTRHFWKNRITRFMLLHCASETELPERSMIMWDMYYPVLSL